MARQDKFGQSSEVQGAAARLVHTFLYSRISLVLIILSVLLGVAALALTPREKDPQILVPMVDVFVHFPGHGAKSTEQLVATPLEKLLYQIKGVEDVYSTSRRNEALVTARFFVGQDVQRSVLKIYREINAHRSVVPPGVTGWVIKPESINDVPVVTLTLASRSSPAMLLRQTAEELSVRLAAVSNVSRAYVIGGRPQVVYVYLNSARLRAFDLTATQISREIQSANVRSSAGSYARNNKEIQVVTGTGIRNARDLGRLVVSVWHQQPVYLRDVAKIVDGPAQVTSYVWHGWGAAARETESPGFPGTILAGQRFAHLASGPVPAVTIAVAKKAGSNAVVVARQVIAKARQLSRDIIPSDMRLIVTRNAGLSANAKVNGLIDGLLSAVVIVILLLTFALGWREAAVVAIAIPVVFGLTLACNLMLGYTINRVTLFALILSLGLLVDDPIVDVENISRHFSTAGRASRHIVFGAMVEILRPLIVATLAVIISFIPMFFITGMMGPYMRPMAFNVPVAMLMSMLVALTITPWVSFHMLKRRHTSQPITPGEDIELMSAAQVKRTTRYKVLAPIMGRLFHHRWTRWGFLGAVAALTVASIMLPALRLVPLKLLPFGNQSSLLVVVHARRGTTLQATDAATRALMRRLERLNETVDATAYVGVAAPMDFNGLVRHYYLRNKPNDGQIEVDLAGKDRRAAQTHAIALRIHQTLTAIAHRYHVRIQLVEAPPGPPVLDTIVGEIYGSPATTYHRMQLAARTLEKRLELEPGVVDVDDSIQAAEKREVFVVNKRKAALNGVTVDQIAHSLKMAITGWNAGIIHAKRQRQPLKIEITLPISRHSSRFDLDKLYVNGSDGRLVPIAELGHWQLRLAGQAIYHKNLRRVVYVYADTAGRPPINAIVDVDADRLPDGSSPRGHHMQKVGDGWINLVAKPRPLAGRTFFKNGSGIAWQLRRGVHINFAGEGELRITEHVFRDLGISFAAAMVGIYVLLVAQTGSFLLPLVMELAIPLTIPGVMPGFYLLNVFAEQNIDGYRDPILFTATAMIGMIALAGIVTRNAVILVDFIHRALRRGQSLQDAITESVVVRMRPILLTAAAAMLSSIPILGDPIFSGLAWALIFGLFASTVFTLLVIPTVYWALFAHKPGHGVDIGKGDIDS